MNRVIRLLFVLFVTLCSLASFAATIPADVQGARAYSKMRCITEATQTCINNQCLTSSSRSCQSDCASMAESKCRLQND